MRIFVDRERELEVLWGALESRGAELVVVYGRRRLGKTTLIKKLLSEHGGVYLLVNYEDRSLALADLSRQLSEQAGLPLGTYEFFRDLFRAALRVAEEKSRGKPLLVIDEAQRLAGTGALAELQSMWDSVLREQSVAIVLVGSGVGTVVRALVSYEAPLYGRATRILRLEGFGYREARIFMKGWSPEDKVKGYAVFGGTPAYLALIDADAGLEENVENLILKPGGPLHEEPLNLLSMETREPDRYLAILSAVARGRRRPGEVASELSLPLNVVSKYLYVLEHALGLVTKEYPLGMEGKPRSARYEVADNFFKFWLAEVWPRRHLLQPPLHTRAVRAVLESLERYASRAWEQVALQHMMLRASTGSMRFTRIGRWWYRSVEVDIVALDEESGTAYFVECKWSRDPVSRRDLEELAKKAKLFPHKAREAKFIFYARSGASFTPPSNTEIITLEDVEEDMDKNKPLTVSISEGYADRYGLRE